MNRITPVEKVTLTSGILADRDRLTIENLLLRVDAEEFASIFAGEHDTWFAEPEFAGQFVDACVIYSRRTGDARHLDRARLVVDAMCTYQREDGYLGTYKAGKEFDETFSVWNQTFVIKGLLSFYAATGEERALTASSRCARYISDYYLAPNAPEILKSVNQCLQNTTILEQLVRLYKLTDEERFLEFAQFIVRRWEETTIKFVTAPNEWLNPLLEMGALKAIESLVCYQGIVELYTVTGEDRLLSAAERYWEQLRKNQINIIGSGAYTELWVFHGSRPANLSIDVRPNETCVSWGWARLSLMLFELTGNARYFDAVEQTLYNHIMGAQAIDGSDFSYYQGHVGQKIHEKHPDQYSCCRYRGLHYYAYTPTYLFTEGEGRIYVNLFASAEATLSDGTLIRSTTDFPRDGRVTIEVESSSASADDPHSTSSIFLRIPTWARSWSVRVADRLYSQENAELDSGYLVLPGPTSPGVTTIEADFELRVQVVEADVDHKPSVAVLFGPLTLATDSRFGTPMHGSAIHLSNGEVSLSRVHETDGPIVRFEAPGTIHGEESEITLVDFASAGSLSPNHDEFKLWIPVAHET